MSNLNVSYEELEAVASQINNGREQLTGQLQQLQSIVENLTASGFQTDRASVAYDSHFREYATRTVQAIDALQAYSEFLTTSAQALRDTDEALAGQLGS